MDNSHAVWIFVRNRTRSTNFASRGSSAYPLPECDPPVLSGLKWAHFQGLPNWGKFEHQMRWRESARGLERGRRRSQVCQDLPRQPAAELRSYCRQLRRISASFPHSSFQERLGEGGVTSGPRLNPGSLAGTGFAVFSRPPSQSQPRTPWPLPAPPPQ